MRAGKGGETCSIVATSTDIDISQTTLNTTTSASVSSTTVTVTDASSFLEKGVCLVGTEVFAYTGKKLGVSGGGTTKDNKFTLHKEECLAACCGAPMMRINDTFYEKLTKEKIDQVLDSLP